MKNISIRTLFACLSLLVASGCVSFTAKLDPDTRLDPKKGYIYGRLAQTHSNGNSAVQSGYLRLGLLIEQKGGSKVYKTQFDRADAVSVIAVEPGVYQLSKVLCVGWDYGPVGETALKDARLTKEFRVDAGRAYYIGDLYGTTLSESTPMGTSVYIYRSWKLDAFRNNYQGTTKDLTTRFPNFKEIPTAPALF
jgi:hypothetical protein